jgi:hypothetical protein
MISHWIVLIADFFHVDFLKTSGQYRLCIVGKASLYMYFIRRWIRIKIMDVKAVGYQNCAASSCSDIFEIECFLKLQHVLIVFYLQSDHTPEIVFS